MKKTCYLFKPKVRSSQVFFCFFLGFVGRFFDPVGQDLLQLLSGAAVEERRGSGGGHPPGGDGTPPPLTGGFFETGEVAGRFLQLLRANWSLK